MMRVMNLSFAVVAVLSILYKAEHTSALSVPGGWRVGTTRTPVSDRRSLLLTSSALLPAVLLPAFAPVPALAAPEIFTTPKGAKYAILQESKEKARPANGDIVAIEYTGYLTDGSIFGMCSLLVKNDDGEAHHIFGAMCSRCHPQPRQKGWLNRSVRQAIYLKLTKKNVRC
jgi:hypothetical protein